MHKERIAIIGIGCRFPGGINDADSFWNLLVEGREAVSEVPADRWNVERFYDPEPGIAGKSIAKRGGFIDGIDQFDPQFFGISPREAPYIDPQQRLLLETAWEAIEDAGVVLDFEKGTDLAVFMGISHNDYQGIQSTPFEHSGISQHSPTGTAHSIAANRISYCLNLKGPSVAMDTACSSALTAVHAACEHIWTGRGDTALAGGVTVMISPGGFIGFSQAGMLSPEGRCAAFAASASGFVRGEGAGVVFLKRLSKAIEDGDPIQGVVVGTALNQDGHTNGISLPSPEAQARLVKDACADAGIKPTQVGYIEAHGTGTAVGDPIEANALAEALCEGRPEDKPLPMGSVKTNLGHLETAAGVAGLVKTMLVLKHRKIPASLHFDEPSPHIDFPKLKLRVPTKLEPFPQETGERFAGVNSFGFGGANAHVVLAEPPAVRVPDHAEVHTERAWPLVLSARSEAALQGAAQKLSDWIEAHSRANGSNGHTPVLPDLSYTLGARRNHHQHRLTMTVRSMEEAVEELRAIATGQTATKSRTSFTPRPEHPPRVAFVMSGQGPQWWGMGRELMAHEPVFRDMMQRCHEALKPWAKFSLLDELNKSEETSQMHRTEIAQPAIFAMQMALTALWKSWGVEPAAIVGHSVGEIAAACAAGVFSLEEGARIIAQRARFMDECARGQGTMLAVSLSEEEIRPIMERTDKTITIAAFNGPRSLTLSGPKSALEAIAAELEPQNIFARLVRVDHPFHHPLMKPASEQLEAVLKDLKVQEETVPFFSTVTGARCHGTDCVAKHWGQGVRQPVLFAPAVEEVAKFGVDVWLEISAHPALARSIQECLAPTGNKAPVISSARREREHDSLLDAAMDLHRAAVTLDFKAITPSRRLLSLPAYAWDKSRCWHESSDWREGRLGVGGRGFLDHRLPRAIPTWAIRLDNRHMAFLKDHKVEAMVIFPAAAFVEIVLEAGVQLFEGRPFAVEDFEIRKPLLLPENPAGLVVEFSYDTSERTFSIQSRMEQSAAWSLHVVGSMRSERTESAFGQTKFPADAHAELDAVELEGFYEHMSDLGLRYGPEFRPLQELSARAGKSAGKVALSENTAKRAAEFKLHPVLLDGALHIFSSGAATVEGRRSRMKLPVRFSRILFLQSPGASSLVRARVQQFSDDFVEGNIELYDKDGNPCVLVDGFRAIAVAGARRAAPGGTRDLVYNVSWQRSNAALPPATTAPVPLTVLHQAAKTALDDVIEARGRDRLTGAMTAADELAAAQIARGFAAMGVKKRAFTANSLKVANEMRPVFGRLSEGLVRHGLLTQNGESFEATPAFAKAARGARAKMRDFVEQNSGHLSEALLVSATCDELGPILRGEKDAVQSLFAGSGADQLDQFYGDGLLTSHWLSAIAGAVQAAARALPEGRGLRILEVGAGTGGLAAYLLPLLERGLHSYTFSDVSAAFFSTAGQKLAAFPEVEFKIFDLEKPGSEQDLESGSYDLVIGTNVLHAVADVRAGLRHVHDLIAPGGTLCFMDVATPHLWTEAVFGLTHGWWRFTDRDLRTIHPLLQRSQWEAALKEVGFAETASLPGLHGPLGEGQIALLARKSTSLATKSAPSDIFATTPSGSSWLVFADESGVSERLVNRLRTSGVRCRVVRRGKGFEQDGIDSFTVRAEVREDWNQLIASCWEQTPPDRLVYLWPLNSGTADAVKDPELMGTDALLHLTQALEIYCPAAKLRFDLITRGAQAAGEESQPTSVEQAAAIGLFRVILNEHPNYLCRGIDLPPKATAADDQFLWSELVREEPEREVAFRGEARYVQRLGRGKPSTERWIENTVPLRLESKERGHLDTLRFVPFAEPVCAPGEVLIEVKAAGMNFRDVLKALALYPGEAPDARIFGDEVAGIVKAVGSEVTHVVPGDRVFGIAVFGIATHTLARGGDVRRMPEGLSFDEAATLPVVFMTSWHALKNVARIRRGETVLVHAGAGGVGMAAIQIAHHLGATVIASAGSTTKRALLETLGVKHVIDSRRGDFAEAVMALTDRRGVDCVLNALAGEAIPMGMSCLAEFGRFIEIGKRDIYQNSRIPLWPLRRNASFHVVAMDAVFAGDEKLTRDMLGEIARLVEQHRLTPLPFRSFPASRIDAAFRLMASGKHIGKVVVAFPEPFVPRRAEPLAKGFEVKGDRRYLLTGAFGGFGKVLARWLVESGARHLALASRSGASSPDAAAFVEELQGRGVDVQVIRADVGVPADVSRMLSEVRASEVPLGGVFHLAMVIDDAPMSALDRDRMKTVIVPKARGAWLLHEGTKDLSLDCFVMFSSVSSIFGNPAQANYSAANAFLDALSHHRHALGLPALTVNWGVLGGQGYVARNERVAEFLARQGTASISPGEVVSLLESFLTAGSAQAIAIRVDWGKWRQFFRGMQENPLLEQIFASGVDAEEASSGVSDWRQRIEAAPAAERQGVISQALREVVGSVLRVKPDSLRDDQPLTDLGLDSLMGVEIENSIESSIGVALPPTSLMRARTIGQIAGLIAEHLGGKPAGPNVTVPAAAPAEVTATEEVDLEALSDEDIDALLGDTAPDRVAEADNVAS